MNALASRRYALAQAGRALVRQPLTTTLALLLAALALALPLLIATLALPLHAAWTRLDAPAQAVVFIAAGTASSDIAAMRGRLAEQPGVASAGHVPRDAALADLARHAPGGALPNLRSNPLPDSIVVTFARGTTPEAAETAVAAIRKLARVEAVQFDGGWYRRWTTAVATATSTAAASAVALVLLAATAIAVAAQLPSVAHRDELRLLALSGASAAFRRRPYTYAGALVGLAGGILANAAVAGALATLAPQLADLRIAAAIEIRWGLLPWPVLAGTIAFAGMIGFMAGSLAGSRAIRRAQP